MGGDQGRSREWDLRNMGDKTFKRDFFLRPLYVGKVIWTTDAFC